MPHSLPWLLPLYLGLQVSNTFYKDCCKTTTAAVTQWAMTGRPNRDVTLYTGELGVYTSGIICAIIAASGGFAHFKTLLHDWKPSTLIPVVSSIAGGFLVGHVTRSSGAVSKASSVTCSS